MSSMAENVPTAVVNLGGRKRTLAFTIGAMRRIRETMGHAKLGEISLGGDTVVDRLAGYMWCLLIKEDREGLTIEDVEEMIFPGNIPALTEAFMSLMPVAKKSEDDAGKAPRKTATPKKRKRRAS